MTNTAVGQYSQYPERNGLLQIRMGRRLDNGLTQWMFPMTYGSLLLFSQPIQEHDDHDNGLYETMSG